MHGDKPSSWAKKFRGRFSGVLYIPMIRDDGREKVQSRFGQKFVAILGGLFPTVMPDAVKLVWKIWNARVCKLFFSIHGPICLGPSLAS